jgi:hypothetical protein
MSQIVYKWQCKKIIDVKERRMFVDGNGFKV